MGNDISKDLPRRRGSDITVRPTKVPEKHSEAFVEGFIKGCGEGWDYSKLSFWKSAFPRSFFFSLQDYNLKDASPNCPGRQRGGWHGPEPPAPDPAAAGAGEARRSSEQNWFSWLPSGFKWDFTKEIEVSLATRRQLPLGSPSWPPCFLAPSLPSRLSPVPVLYWFVLGDDRRRASMKRGRLKGLLLALGHCKSKW